MIDPEVLHVYYMALQEITANPSSIYQEGQKAKAHLVEARKTIAKALQTQNHPVQNHLVQDQEIIFTSCATEALNLILRGFFGYTLKGHVITTDCEHAAVFETLKALQAQGLDVTFLPVGAYGAVRPDQIQNAIRSDTKLITCMAVNNETGVCTDIDAISVIALENRIPFVVDAVALLGKKAFQIPEGVTAMVFSGHKFHAPRGTAFSFIRKKQVLYPFCTGGDQEYGRRSGTEHVAGCIALAKATVKALSNVDVTSKSIEKLRDHFEKTLKARLPNIAINGTGNRVCNTSNIRFSGVDAETLVMQLDLQGVACSLGSACASGGIEPSRILLNMGLTPSEAMASVRFSLSRFTTKDEIDTACATIVQAVQKMSHW